VWRRPNRRHPAANEPDFEGAAERNGQAKLETKELMERQLEEER
jgi:hypothetical protein